MLVGAHPEFVFLMGLVAQRDAVLLQARQTSERTCALTA
jgi:hypothetical protein